MSESAATPPGIKSVREIPLLAVLVSAALTPFALVVWLVTAPFLLLHTVSAVLLSGVTQRDWFALARSMPPKEPS